MIAARRWVRMFLSTNTVHHAVQRGLSVAERARTGSFSEPPQLGLEVDVRADRVDDESLERSRRALKDGDALPRDLPTEHHRRRGGVDDQINLAPQRGRKRVLEIEAAVGCERTRAIEAKKHVDVAASMNPPRCCRAEDDDEIEVVPRSGLHDVGNDRDLLCRHPRQRSREATR